MRRNRKTKKSLEMSPKPEESETTQKKTQDSSPDEGTPPREPRKSKSKSKTPELKRIRPRMTLLPPNAHQRRMIPTARVSPRWHSGRESPPINPETSSAARAAQIIPRARPPIRTTPREELPRSTPRTRVLVTPERLAQAQALALAQAQVEFEVQAEAQVEGEAQALVETEPQPAPPGTSPLRTPEADGPRFRTGKIQRRMSKKSKPLRARRPKAPKSESSSLSSSSAQESGGADSSDDESSGNEPLRNLKKKK